jgi:hypothetical protein
MMEAAELVGKSERQFRRYRTRFEEEGEAGLIDCRLGKASPKRIAAAEVAADAGSLSNRLSGMERQAAGLIVASARGCHARE